MARRTRKTPDKRDGVPFEEEVLKRYEDVRFTRHRSSGSVFGDGDIGHPNFLIDCKDHSRGEAFGLPVDDLRKNDRQAADWNKRWWVRFERNVTGRVMVTMPEDMFRQLMLLAEEFDW